MSSTNTLARIEDARSKQDYRGALTAALEVWRETRAVVVAEAIDEIGQEAKRTFVVPTDLRTNAEFQKKWLELVKSKDPIAVEWLAENLLTKLPGSAVDEKMESLVGRFRAVRKVPDPRVATALLKVIEQSPAVYRWPLAETECRKTMAEIGDVRTGLALDAVIPTLAKNDARAWATTREKLPKGKPLSSAERDRWSALGGGGQKTRSGASGASTADRDALFKAVLDNPADDQAIAVLADCLQELEDPRGEFIAIQLAEAQGRGTPDGAKKADALLKKHKKTWLGPLARVTYRATFRRGVLADLELDGSWKAPKKVWAELAKDPLLATVECIHGKPTPDIMAGFFSSPAMRSLREVEIGADVVADAVEKFLPPSVHVVSSWLWKRHDYVKRFTERVLPFIERTPAIDSLVCSDDAIEVLLESKVCSRLKNVRLVFGGIKTGFDLWSRLPANITKLSFYDVEILRTAKKSVSIRLLPTSSTEDFREIAKLAAKLDGLERIEIEAPKKLLDASKLDGFDGLKKKGVVIDAHEAPARSGRATGID